MRGLPQASPPTAPPTWRERGRRSWGSLRADRSGRGTRREGRSLAALLDVGLHELLGVLLQHGVDLVQDLVHLVGELLALVGRLGARGLRRRSVLSSALGSLLFLLLRH